MTKPYRTLVLVVLALAVVLAGAYVVFTKKALSPSHEELADGMLRYESAEHGFSFSYPEGYVVREHEDAGHFQVLLVAEADAEPVANGEGPIAVAVDVYPGAGSDPLAWMNESPASNYQLGSKQHERADVAGHDGYSYAWSGLYEGRTTAVANESTIFALSVTWLTPADHTLGLYEQVVRSFRFDDGSVLGEQKG